MGRSWFAVPAAMVAFGWLLYRLNALYEGLHGAPEGPPARSAWLVSSPASQSPPSGIPIQRKALPSTTPAASRPIRSARVTRSPSSKRSSAVT